MTIKKTICLIIIALAVFSLSACGTSSDSSNENSNGANNNSYVETKIEYSSQAIRAVKNYMSGTFLSVEQQIAGKLGFNNFYSPDYATETAKQNYDDSWDVTLKGKMSGYVDDYNDDFKSYKFEVTAEVSEDGDVSNIRVKRVY